MHKMIQTILSKNSRMTRPNPFMLKILCHGVGCPPFYWKNKILKKTSTWKVLFNLLPLHEQFFFKTKNSIWLLLKRPTYLGCFSYNQCYFWNNLNTSNSQKFFLHLQNTFRVGSNKLTPYPKYNILTCKRVTFNWRLLLAFSSDSIEQSTSIIWRIRNIWRT